MTKQKFNKIVKELKIMSKNSGYYGSVKVEEGETRALVEYRTKEMILETAKENKYLHGAIINCDNYSIKVENNELVFVFGFEW